MVQIWDLGFGIGIWGKKEFGIWDLGFGICSVGSATL
jgi:hypothetical protein